MKRDLRLLGGEPVDILVVGAGIHGAAAAWAASLQGLSTALIDRGDFGSATSANSLKIIHGGLRYLQSADFGRMRRSILARRRLMRLAPHMIEPLPCVIPTRGRGVRGRGAMRAALSVNDLVGIDRNRGLGEENRLPGGKVISRRRMLEIAPRLEGEGITGGAVWYDGLALNTERLTLGFIVSAASHGARVMNYMRAESFLMEGRRVKGVRARDLNGRTTIDIRASAVIDATGPWSSGLVKDLMEEANVPTRKKWAKAVNLVIGRSLFGNHAVGLPCLASGAKKEQVFFFVPWRGGTMIGTRYTEYDGPPSLCRLTGDDLEDMSAVVKQVYRAGNLDSAEVRFAHVGLVPVDEGGESADLNRRLLARPDIVDFGERCGVDGLVSICGVKYTTGCEVGERAARMAMGKLGRPWKEPGKEEPLYGEERGGALDSVDEATAKHLRESYGGRAGEVAALTERNPSLAERVSPDQPVTGAEVVYAVREEMAVTLADVVFRRTGLGSFGHPGSEALKRCADLVASELGWVKERARDEIGRVEILFQLP